MTKEQQIDMRGLLKARPADEPPKCVNGTDGWGSRVCDMTPDYAEAQAKLTEHARCFVDRMVLAESRDILPGEENDMPPIPESLKRERGDVPK